MTACARVPSSSPRPAKDAVILAVTVLDCRPSITRKPESAAQSRAAVPVEIHRWRAAPNPERPPLLIGPGPQIRRAPAPRKSTILIVGVTALCDLYENFLQCCATIVKRLAKGIGFAPAMGVSAPFNGLHHAMFCPNGKALSFRISWLQGIM